MPDRKKMIARVFHFPYEVIDKLHAIKKNLGLSSLSDAIIVAVDAYEEAIEPNDDGPV
ncbi:MAG: hypothetical protein ACXABY_29910 [Candidatus Thorarchaeota archaeon]|jgi:hypothetical protein